MTWLTEEASRRASSESDATWPRDAARLPAGADRDAHLAALLAAEELLTSVPRVEDLLVLPSIRLSSRRALADEARELTSLLHRAYGNMAARNIRFLATHQSVEVTLDRTRETESWVTVEDDRIVGTVSLYPPGVDGGGHEWFGRPGVAKFIQLAVEPSFKRRGLGSALISLAESRAIELGATEIAIDTAVPATDLRSMYRARGYEHVTYCDYRPNTNYPSVVMSKRLG